MNTPREITSKWKHAIGLCCFALLLAVGAFGCSPPGVYNWKSESAAAYKVGSGDLLKISVWKHEELSTAQVAVRPDGFINVALVGEVSARGKTTLEIGADIANRLKQFYQDQAPVSVQLLEVKSYRVYVLGEVTRAGEYPASPDSTVLQMLALAGGFTRFADPTHIVILRRDAKGERRIPVDYYGIVEKGDLQQNLSLLPGDTVVVP
ncbi:MAG: polysaccharide biosynthesis/export family protein [Polyangiaceae bacterium]|nr:polysaccharide biosynthesis/export family protein [Polyangiaceae bacterium]